MRGARAVAVALSLAAPLVADAQPRGRPLPGGPDQGIYLAGRLGVGAPSGDLSEDLAGGAPLDALVDRKVALWFEIGYRFDPRVRAGFYLELAPTSLEPAACFRPGCDASDVRFGVDVQLHLGPGRTLDPWLGLGVGVEYLTAEIGDDLDGDGLADADAELTYAGIELPLVEGGLEIRLAPRFSLGPFVSFSFARFTSVLRERPGARERRAAIEDEAMHGWLQVGVRGNIDL